MRMPYKPASNGEVDTFVDMDNEEREVIAYWESSPAEPDVNWGGDFEVTQVKAQGIDITDLLSDDELQQLTYRVQEHVNDMYDPDAYGDYLYEQEKDRRLEND